MISHTQTFHCFLCFTAEVLKKIGHSIRVSQCCLIMNLVSKSLDKSGPLNRLASEQSYTRVCQWAIEIYCKDSLLTIYQPVNECIYRVYLSGWMHRVWLNLTRLGSWCTPGSWVTEWCTTWARVVQWTVKLWMTRGTGLETITNRRWCTDICRSQQWRNDLRNLATQFFWTLHFGFCWPRNWRDCIQSIVGASVHDDMTMLCLIEDLTLTQQEWL